MLQSYESSVPPPFIWGARRSHFPASLALSMLLAPPSSTILVDDQFSKPNSNLGPQTQRETVRAISETLIMQRGKVLRIDHQTRQANPDSGPNSNPDPNLALAPALTLNQCSLKPKP